jgi:hypothetical protein
MRVFTVKVKVVTDFGKDIKIENATIKILAENLKDAENKFEEKLMRDEVSIASNKPFSEVYIDYVDSEGEIPEGECPEFAEENLETQYLDI